LATQEADLARRARPDGGVEKERERPEARAAMGRAADDGVAQHRCGSGGGGCCLYGLGRRREYFAGISVYVAGRSQRADQPAALYGCAGGAMHGFAGYLWTAPGFAAVAHCSQCRRACGLPGGGISGYSDRKAAGSPGGRGAGAARCVRARSDSGHMSRCAYYRGRRHYPVSSWQQ
jgi:hypothetical protein